METNDETAALEARKIRAEIAILERPFYRNPTFWSSLGAFVLVAIGGVGQFVLNRIEIATTRFEAAEQIHQAQQMTAEAEQKSKVAHERLLLADARDSLSRQAADQYAKAVDDLRVEYQRLVEKKQLIGTEIEQALKNLHERESALEEIRRQINGAKPNPALIPRIQSSGGGGTRQVTPGRPQSSGGGAIRQ